MHYTNLRLTYLPTYFTKGLVDIALLHDAQEHFTISEVAADWHEHYVAIHCPH